MQSGELRGQTRQGSSLPNQREQARNLPYCPEPSMLSKELKKTILRLTEDGLSPVEISEKVGKTPASVRGVLYREGERPAPRVPRAAGEWPEAELALVQKMWKEGKTYQQMECTLPHRSVDSLKLFCHRRRKAGDVVFDYRRKGLSNKYDVGKVVKLRKDGLPLGKIAERMGCAPSTIWHILRGAEITAARAARACQLPATSAEKRSKNDK
jgi:DNA-binding CsgD family transcriptional regulator